MSSRDFVSSAIIIAYSEVEREGSGLAGKGGR